ncbi:hypothetical protein GCK72_008122 [Caenorhabditis remanei]|uniref:Uncharacterized protein n=1 Tax=Caenorhabditis remanei TaxID=31234 RepID=A0A6A5HJ13_CAERE|nr:hypothetical protein GCK72_008122 [Caenorhabditis remanei]KAF1768160.1 hypothetical protein GCK72_008122 [Caenorhabditis remanei]
MSYKYKICCELLELCSFYHQSWFIYVCAGAGAFLVIGMVSIMILVFICTRKRGPKAAEGKTSGDQKKKGFFKSKSGKGSKDQGSTKKSSKNKISKRKK